MTKHLLAGVAAVVLMSGVAFAQTYPPAPPPMPVAPTAPVPPDASTSTTTTTVAPGAEGYRATTVKKGVDINGNEVTEKNIYKNGISGSTETHAKTKTDPYGGDTTTRSTTTTTTPPQ
jgi:hypothetical protein